MANASLLDAYFPRLKGLLVVAASGQQVREVAALERPHARSGWVAESGSFCLISWRSFDSDLAEKLSTALRTRTAYLCFEKTSECFSYALFENGEEIEEYAFEPRDEEEEDDGAGDLLDQATGFLLPDPWEHPNYVAGEEARGPFCPIQDSDWRIAGRDRHHVFRFNGPALDPSSLQGGFEFALSRLTAFGFELPSDFPDHAIEVRLTSPG